MDWWVWALIALVVFGAGFWSGVATLHAVWLKPGLQKGTLDFGNITYRMSPIVRRNTRI